MLPLCLILIIFWVWPYQADAYPQFIGYKYSSCLTCHYNSQGNGPLNDYGRALWSAEIAGRVWAGKKTDEQLAERSGFLGSRHLPNWLRPGIKARQLWVQSNPGSPNAQDRSILMQAEANLAIFFDEEQKYAFVGSYGHAPTPFRLQGQNTDEVDNWISREHYFRWQAREDLWVYTGMLDKAFGIRHANHTAYSRSRTGLGPNDQTHGVMVHYIQPKFEITGHAFTGNLFQDSDLRQKGGSTLVEYEVADSWRIGFSGLYSSNSYVKNTRFAIHSRSGLGHGSAVLFEAGMIDNTPNEAATTSGYYTYTELIQRVTRGYHLFVTGQSYKNELSASSPHLIRMGTGLLLFPMARTEFRFEVENTMTILSGPQTPNDAWSALGQVHLSL